MKEIVLDTETTGLSVRDGHRIVEIGCIELDNLIPTKNIFHIYLNPERKVSQKAFEVHGYTDEFLSKQKKFSEMNHEALEKGFEGLMIKPNNNYYECKRSHAWLKIKPFIEVTLKVIDIQEGTGKHEGKLGAFSVEGEDDGKFFSLSVGSGLSDDQRDKYWAAKDKLIGRLIEVRADAITQSIEGEHFSLRFPRFKCFRGFKEDEKI